MNREKILSKLKDVQEFDIIVIGGGATGAGISLDASSRGLKVLLVEKNDFSEGTSSRSTKLVHGGVRYLEKAVKHLDKEQFSLVKEGLHERGILLKNAPHLSNKICFVTPLYKWYELPYIFAGLKLYDILSGKMRLGKSKLLSKSKTLEYLPMLNENKLKGGVLYYDGQFNDARMVISLIKTATQYGTLPLNYMEAVKFEKQDKKISGLILKDKISNTTYQVKSKCIINATGPFADQIRKIDNPKVKNILRTSSGIHIVLDKKFAPTNYGMMIPGTEDDRVVFVLPWQNHALIGTTDNPCEINEHPSVQEKEIDYVLKQVGQYFKTSPEKKDILSLWSGIRPLVFDPSADNTQELARTHVIEISDSNLVTITGGKWTSYRRMAEDTVDKVIDLFKFDTKACITKNLKISGSEGYTEKGHELLQKSYNIEKDIAIYLNNSYGFEAEKIVLTGLANNTLKRLADNLPYTEAEVYYSITEEMTVHVVDFLIRRSVVALLNLEAARKISHKILDIMSKYLNWSDNRIMEEKIMIEERLSKSI